MDICSSAFAFRLRQILISYLYKSLPQIVEKENCNSGLRVAIVLLLNRFAKKF